MSKGNVATITSTPALDDILEIPGNRHLFSELQHLLAQKKAVAFVGAGASAGMYPLWGELIGQLADFAVEKSKAEPRDRDRWKADHNSNPQQRVNTILRKLGDDYYRQFLRQTFAPRRGPDGRRYTSIHATLLRLPFRGYVTTNYDPALEFARMELRPGCLTTGTPTWEDDEIHGWLTGDVFEPADACPILWLHGYWQRPTGIVLNAGEYATAYRPGLYRKTFQRLWEQDHLVFAGFGFNDPQFTFMVGEILRDIAGAHAIPRHIALLGLQPDANGSPPEPEALAEGRTSMEEDYHVRPLFYPVKLLPDGGQDHSALSILLDGLAAIGTYSVSAPISHVSSPPKPAALPSRWSHERTHDARFTGRENERERLDRWVADPAVRAIGICAVGGAGKTSLVGHWLMNTTGWRSRPFAGLFAWSFYQERRSPVFLRELLQWASDAFGTSEPTEETVLVPTALELLQTHPFLIVLDGLEVLQEGPEDSRHGAFLDGVLRDFLGGLSVQHHESLAILTSRFLFADLERHLGTSFHQLELSGLAQQQGATLLAQLHVRGAESDRMYVSRQLEGHPLGLRVFSEAIPETRRDYPREFLDDAFRTGQLSAHSPLTGKVKRLLVFYEKKLPLTQVRLLGVVALFRAPVAEETILYLARGLFVEGSEPLPDNTALVRELRKLHTRGILSRTRQESRQEEKLAGARRLLKVLLPRAIGRKPILDGHSYACHPILRDHFRAVLLGAGTTTARRAADLLQGQPSQEQPRSVKEIEPILLAIELLLDAGDFHEADNLYRGPLENGKLFLLIPALAEGLRCALGFVRDEARRQQCSRQLSRHRLGFFLNEVGLFANLSGQYDLAARFCTDGAALARELRNAKNLGIALRHETRLLVHLGRLAEAGDRIAEALLLAASEPWDDESQLRNTYADRGWVRGLSGQVRAAAEDFATANVFEQKNHYDGRELFSLRGIQWTELLFRTGHTTIAARRTTANLRICELYGRKDYSARCRWVLGACALAEGRLAEAETELQQAEAIFHSGQLLFDLARVHVTAGSVTLAQRDPAAAHRRVIEALALAQPRSMRLVHADALVLRGRARLLEATSLNEGSGEANLLARALDDADDALRLARECGYVWAECDALRLQADVHSSLALAQEAGSNLFGSARHRDAAHCASTEAENLSLRLLLTTEDLAEAETLAARYG